MIESKRVHHLILTVTTAVVLSLTSCSSSADNPGKAPRVTTIPAQEALGGAMFSLDLADWVTEPNGAPVGYSVVAGGGVVSGSTYTQQFHTVGAKSVQLTASNGTRSTTFSFVVDVQTGYETVIQAGTSLVLLDRGTVHNAAMWQAPQLYSTHFLTVSNSQGYADAFKAALNRGHTIYERTRGSQTDLYVFNPSDRVTTRLGDDPNFATDEKYEAKTADNRIVFTSGTTGDTDLYIYNVMTGLTREISAVLNSHERNAMVDANDIVYFESGPSAQRDIYFYDPSKDELDPISTSAKNEVIVGTVKGGGVVFTRDEGAGDVDLWFYKPGIGLAQVAADVATSGFQDNTLTYNSSTTSGKVVFTEAASGTDSNLFYWDPATLTTTTVAANAAVNDVFNGCTTNDKIVYTHEVSGSDWDIHARTVGGADVNLSGASGAQDVYQGTTLLNDVVMFRDANDLYVYDDSATTLLTADVGGGSALTFVAGLNGGNVLYTKAGGGLYRWETSNSAGMVSATGAYAGQMENGVDFVIKNTVSSQDDLYLWLEASDSVAVVSDTPADERFIDSTVTSSGVVFTRQGANSNYDLYVWDASNGIRQLTSTEDSHTFVARFFMDNR